MLLEFIKLILYSFLIVIISRYILIETIRKLAESLNINAKITGNITGVATSIPEVLTISNSTLRGLFGASLYNILSSNIINLIQYISTIFLNKNINKLKNRAIITDIVLVLITILIPIVLLNYKIELNISLVPLFILLYFFFTFLNNSVHKTYLILDKYQNEKQNTYNKTNIRKIFFYSILIIVSGVLLYIVGNLLGDTLEILCAYFGVSQLVIGIILGFITSIPEFISFLESQKHYKRLKNDMLGVVEATNNLLTSNTLNLFIIQTLGILLIGIK